MLSILLIITFIIALFYGYSYYVKVGFENYLSEKYPSKTFEVGFPNYSLISYNTILIGDYFNTSSYCIEDGTRFTMSRKKGEITDSYLVRRNEKKLKDIVSTYVTESGFNKYVQSINIGIKSEINLNVEKLEDFNNSIEVVIIYYNENIQDNKNFADVSYEIINFLKSKKLNFDAIYFTSDRKNGVFELNLKGEDINKDSTKLLNMIEKRR